MTAEEWLLERTFRGAAADAGRLAERARRDGLTVSVCLPALDVEATVGPIVESIRRRFVEQVPLVDELAIVDGGSRDATCAVAREAGARVIDEREVLPELGTRSGKGEGLWKSLAALTGDLVCWIDADIVDFDPQYVPALLAPLIEEPGVAYVKGAYDRRIAGVDLGGGRVTEICARPLINQFFPELAGFSQPLSGEAAGRAEVLRRVPFFGGYGVEIGLLIDLLDEVGLPGLAQVELAPREHVNQTTRDLGRMASTIIQVVMTRLADRGRAPRDLAGDGRYAIPVSGPDGPRLAVTSTRPAERPRLDGVLARSPRP